MRSGARIYAGIIVWLALAATTVRGGPIIVTGDSWRYFKGSAAPSNNWNQLGFGDSVWLGPSASGFGFGDNDDATVLGDMQNNYRSVFIRKTFVIADTSTVTRLTLAADYDDGFVAYLNGQEVVRANMPAGLISNTSTAAANHECSRTDDAVGSNDKEFFALDPGLLVNGTNVLAVSGHNVSLGSSDMSLVIELYTDVTLLRGPFIQLPETNGLAVAWRTDALTDGVVEYGFDTNYAAGAVTNLTLVRYHGINITNVLPGTSYYYRVISGGVVLSEGKQFKTRRAPNQPFRVVVVGDFGYDTPDLNQVAAQINATNAHLAFTVGDNIYYHGQPGDFDRYWFTPYRTTMETTPMMATLGNHDSEFLDARWTATNFFLPQNGPAGVLPETVYSYDYGNAHFAVIDSNPFYSNETANITTTTTWLTNDLAHTTQTWKFIAFHHPGYTSSGGHGEDAQMKAYLAPIAEKYGVQICFQGHNHFYERINPINGVRYITSGGGGQSLNTVTFRQPYSAEVNDFEHSYVIMDIDGKKLSLRAMNATGSQIGSMYLELDHPFKMDGILDNPAWVRASNTLNTIKLYAAIRGNYLYVAGQDAPPPANGNNDHFIFINTNLTGNSVAANWSKAGSNMQWSAFLGDESVNGFVGWFGSGQEFLSDPQTYQSTSSGLFENGTNKNGALEGTLNLPAHFGNFPPELCLAFAPYTTINGGTVLWEYQIPPATAGDNINSNEYLRVTTRSLALDLPSAEAGSNQTAEAGMWVPLDGSQSTAPSGLPLSYAWSLPGGPGGQFSNGNAALAAFRLTNDVPAATNVTMQLTVNDTRFDSNDTAQITFTPMLDTDADGLSDQEELTGLNNLLTLADPQGATSDPNDRDSDDDGVSDGNEALAGTDRNSASSVFKVVESTSLSDTNVVIRWSSVTGKLYTLHGTTNLLESLVPIDANIPATQPVNTYTVIVDQAAQTFYIIEVQP